MHSKAKFLGIANIIKAEFQGHHAPCDTNQQGNSANSQQVKGEAMVQNITPIHVIPTPPV